MGAAPCLLPRNVCSAHVMSAVLPPQGRCRPVLPRQLAQHLEKQCCSHSWEEPAVEERPVLGSLLTFCFLRYGVV